MRAVFELPSGGDAQIDLSVTRGPVRLFGVALEGSSGIVWDNLGLISNSAFHLARIDAQAWSEAIELRAPDLVVIALGANDVDWIVGDPRRLQGYSERFTALVEAARGTSGRADCLVVGVLDHAAVIAAGRVAVAVSAAQQRAARLAGCAFFNTLAWMGGPGSIDTWRRRRWVAGDGVHLTASGGRRLGDALADVLLDVDHGIAASSVAAQNQ